MITFVQWQGNRPPTKHTHFAFLKTILRFDHLVYIIKGLAISPSWTISSLSSFSILIVVWINAQMNPNWMRIFPPCLYAFSTFFQICLILHLKFVLEIEDCNHKQCARSLIVLIWILVLLLSLKNDAKSSLVSALLFSVIFFCEITSHFHLLTSGPCSRPHVLA